MPNNVIDGTVVDCNECKNPNSNCCNKAMGIPQCGACTHIHDFEFCQKCTGITMKPECYFKLDERKRKHYETI